MASSVVVMGLEESISRHRTCSLRINEVNMKMAPTLGNKEFLELKAMCRKKEDAALYHPWGTKPTEPLVLSFPYSQLVKKKQNISAMASPLACQSLQNFATAFHYCWTCPFTWDKTSKKFVATKALHLLITWIIVVFLVTPIVCGVCIVTILLQIYGTISPPLTSFFVCVIIAILTFFVVTVELVMFLYVEEFTAGCNHLTQISRHDRKHASPHRKIDPLGLFLNFNVALFSIYPYFLCPFLFYFDLDPGLLFTRYVLHLELNTLLDQLVTQPLRFLQFLAILQLCRLFPILVSTFSLCITIFLDAIHKLESRAFLIRFYRSKADLQMRKYRELALVLKLVDGVVVPAAAILMGLGLLLSVVFNFVTIKLYSVIPMPLYLYFPSVSVLIPVIIEALLPFGISLNVKAVQLRNKWDRQLERCGDRKYVRRILRAIKPFCINCGVAGYNVLKLVKGTKVWFYEQLLNYTISALLTSTNLPA
ncbi:hypothetical protein Fcan01_17752 [Folsomia candida]|uniref:Uncharacterized protein n=1 Tax=Folsomia candida TaxID=158441 RepID=A0A226DS94_FOLCA|nr:hypothetical protein Fcan01_17752 [Folsomia candida]